MQQVITELTMNVTSLDDDLQVERQLCRQLRQSLDEATKYQEAMTRKGYSRSFIVAYKDGEEITDF